MKSNRKIKNIFADKATLIIRRILQDPEKKWVVRDFTITRGVSLGMAQEVLEAMTKHGYVERIKKVPMSYTFFHMGSELIAREHPESIACDNGQTGVPGRRLLIRLHNHTRCLKLKKGVNGLALSHGHIDHETERLLTVHELLNIDLPPESNEAAVIAKDGRVGKVKCFQCFGIGTIRVYQTKRPLSSTCLAIRLRIYSETIPIAQFPPELVSAVRGNSS